MMERSSERAGAEARTQVALSMEGTLAEGAIQVKENNPNVGIK